MRISHQTAPIRLLRSSNRAPSSRCANKWFATETNRKTSGKDFSPFAYTWLTRTPQAIPKNADDILSSLPSKSSVNVASDSVPLLLVTPSFAHWIDTSNPFLGSLIGRLYPDLPKSMPLYAIAAVIDKLPNSTHSGRSITGDSGDSEFESSQSEGLSLLTVQRENVRGKAAAARRIGGPAGEESDLVISIQDTNTSNGTAHEVGIRLANTVFINGKESTLMGMRWFYNDDVGAYIMSKAVNLTSCSLTSVSSATNPSLTIPLDPVGERRRVITGMGNILRQVSKSTDPTSVEPMPASTELEMALPRYIKEHNILDQRVSVWALIEKPDLVIADREFTSTQDRVTQSLRKGGKLHRVMSGGGGWGKKQGLLSLDPEFSFPGMARPNGLVTLDQIFNPSADAPMDMPSFLANGMIGEDLSLLSQVATEGDFIEFFVGLEPKHSQDEVTSNTDAQASVTYRFGVVANADEVDTESLVENKEDLVVVPSLFGALSEKAITYSQPVVDGAETSRSCTKLDIPGCRVTVNPVQ
ncbi:nonribosomal peptide synthase [Penicillium atrosanguineum]|uniref:nonribosomal peptide synthase n=1 Tax=Penicillium atrosanguineum TaxID=1132637 RepID=UPI00239009D0|nr:nonribosomal peptide synthase [Penicillium atrosanguineum]KAJ5290096.1 nonribosomal peptide synthase [Penicillium atrosanguineum]